ncbi:MAG: B12-binding domain-containing radical SAM protein [Candidatus Kariarchaeaceae archaeon]|jgi:radical SAM superfamily enzyme YgiQ (UPF0313 family)
MKEETNFQRTVLMLNASNFTETLTYPYAFVQVSEIADRFNINVIRKDMYIFPQNQWKKYLQSILNENEICMILITVRNTDTFDYEQYQVFEPEKDYHKILYSSPQARSKSNYFPITQTKYLVSILREITELPIVLGGYAFTLLPDKIMQYIIPDFGVIGGPDDFFAQFENILLKKDLDSVSNLVYYKGNLLHKGKIEYFPPADRVEYTTDIITERQAFNSHFEKYSVKSVAIEISRGCPFKCLPCSEPIVKGKTVRYRDLDVIEDEINFLGSHGLNDLFFICSELKLSNNTFVTDLADRIIKINENREPEGKVKWGALVLLNLNPQEWKHLRKSGFTGGWYDVMSLDDENLKKIRPPCTSDILIQNIHNIKQVIEDERQNMTLPSFEESIYNNKNPASSSEVDSFLKKQWSWFIGSVATTPETVKRTLKKISQENFDQYFDSAWLIRITRIFDHQNPDDSVIENTWTMSPDGLLDKYDDLFPSFAYPPALMKHFENIDALEEFYTIIEDTFLSKNHQFKKDWNWFLTKNLSLDVFHSWWCAIEENPVSIASITEIPEVREFLEYLSKDSTVKSLALLYNPTPNRKKLMNHSAHKAIIMILLSRENELLGLLKYLDLPAKLDSVLSLSPYVLTYELFKTFENKEDLIFKIKNTYPDNNLIEFFVEYLLYLKNIPLLEEYRIFFLDNQ